MTYVDGFVASVPTENKTAFRDRTEAAAAVLTAHGALGALKGWGDDAPDGEVTSFPMAVRCKAGETVCLSWILRPSRQVRNRAMPKPMADPRLDPEANRMPFDGKRMIHGGFEVLVDA